MTNPYSHPKYGQWQYHPASCPKCPASARQAWPDEKDKFDAKCLNEKCGLEFKVTDQNCRNCRFGESRISCTNPRVELGDIKYGVNTKHESITYCDKWMCRLPINPW